MKYLMAPLSTTIPSALVYQANANIRKLTSKHELRLLWCDIPLNCIHDSGWRDGSKLAGSAHDVQESRRRAGIHSQSAGKIYERKWHRFFRPNATTSFLHDHRAGEQLCPSSGRFEGCREWRFRRRVQAAGRIICVGRWHQNGLWELLSWWGGIDIFHSQLARIMVKRLLI